VATFDLEEVNEEEINKEETMLQVLGDLDD